MIVIAMLMIIIMLPLLLVHLVAVVVTISIRRLIVVQVLASMLGCELLGLFIVPFLLFLLLLACELICFLFVLAQ